MNLKTTIKRTLFCLSVVVAVFALGSCTNCKKDKEGVGVHTLYDYTVVSPSNWNELTYQDNNDTQIMSHIGSSFFEFDFEFDAQGNPVEGGFEVEYSAATNLEDVSAQYVGSKYGVPEDAKGRAYKITLRDDLKWDDGTPIKAEDFVYTMKEQLNPLFKNYRADSFYAGSLIIHNAKNYLYSGDEGWYDARSPYSVYSEDIDSKLYFKLGPAVKGGTGMEAVENTFRTGMGFPASYDAKAVATYITTVGVNNVVDATVEEVLALEGKTLAEIKADAALKATWEKVLACWKTAPNEELDFFVTYYEWPVVDFDEVGFFVGDKDTELVVVLDAPLSLLEEDGSLSYRAAYNLSSFPLVKKDLYEQTKVAPTDANGLWTSTYNSSRDTTASWGPYKLASFQAGKEYVLVRNNQWYGYNMEKYEGQYQTDQIIVETITEWNTAWLKFLAGEIDNIGIDPSIASEYKTSPRALFTPSDLVASLQIQSDKDSLKERETDGVNKTILSYTDFRKAMSLAINRADYVAKCTTSSLAGFGLFNSMHYYDVAHGGVYRNEDVAKQVLCDVYAVDPSEYDSLDDAVAALNGYNLEEARSLVTKAYNEALAAGDIKATDKVVIQFGTSADNESTRRHFNYLTNAFTEMVKGTPLEGRLETTLKDCGEEWADEFRSGGTDLLFGAGWSGGAWDPGYFLMAYLDANYRYATAWDTTKVNMTFTMPGSGYDGAGQELTMTLMNWWYALNGQHPEYDWSEGTIPTECRLALIAQLEKVILETYYTVPVYNSYSATLLSHKVDYLTTEYNTFMGYGGIRYMTYNYDDAEWAKYVDSQSGQLNYR